MRQHSVSARDGIDKTVRGEEKSGLTGTFVHKKKTDWYILKVNVEICYKLRIGINGETRFTGNLHMYVRRTHLLELTSAHTKNILAEHTKNISHNTDETTNRAQTIH